MKRSVFLFAAACLISGMTNFAAPREAQWKAVEEAINKGLPETAIALLDPIITAAMAEKAHAEAVKAIGRKIAQEGAIQGNRAEERVTRLKAEAAKAPPEMKPVMQALLAHWYWNYFQQNRWRLSQRTQTSEAPGEDFTTWPLALLFAEIDKHFQGALAAEPLLKATPISAWDALLEKGAMPDSYRPTLFDFLAHEALAFYASGEQAGARPEGSFELKAESPIFDEARLFLRWRPAGADSAAGKAIAIYQRLLDFHQGDADPSAFLDADLARLTWGWNTAVGEDKNPRFKEALRVFLRRAGNHPLEALAFWNLARVTHQEGDWAEARRLAQEGRRRHPESAGGKRCANLILEIEAKSAIVTTEHAWVFKKDAGGLSAPGAGQGGEDLITVRYRNLDRLYFRAIAADWESFLDRRRPRPEHLDEQSKREVLGRAPALEWTSALPATPEYKERSVQVAAPSGLRPGFYFIFASHDAGFGEKDNRVSMTTVWVSELALVARTRAGLFEGFVLEAQSGEPLERAEVQAWYLDRNGNRVAARTMRTDANGLFSMEPVQQRAFLFRARHGGRELALSEDVWTHPRGGPDERPRRRTTFFTDRAIYRPGQTIHYKGIVLEADQSRDRYAALPGREIEVVFRDVNGQEVARAQHRSNDYGSFAGSFTAPRDRVMGAMSLAVENNAPGQTHIRVEEYKRPKFEVSLDAPKEAPKLGETVSVAGRAVSYTGAAVDGASVRWRVTREMRWPWWRGGFPSRNAEEIAHGAAATGTDGAFRIEFPAKPDLQIAPSDQPIFIYSITADVTDNTGETRSGDRKVRAGYAALEAVLSADEWQEASKPVEITLRVTTLDGEGQASAGTVKFHRLQQPARVVRAPLGEPFHVVGEDEQGRGDLSDMANWKLGELVEERRVTTDTNGSARISIKLAAGPYRAVIETQDRFGKPVTGQLPVLVLDPDAAVLGVRLPHLLAAPSWETQPGEEFRAIWGTGYDAGRAFVEIEHKGAFLRRFWTTPGRTQQQITIAVTEAMRGGFTLHVTQVRENRAYLQSRTIEAPWKNKEFDLKWERLVSKLQPGQKETWSLIIAPVKDSKTSSSAVETVAAEFAATLYDASLDAFAPMHWRRGFDVFRIDRSDARSRFANELRSFLHAFGAGDPMLDIPAITYREFPDDLTQGAWRGRGRGGAGMELGALASMDAPRSMAMPAPAPARAERAGKSLPLEDLLSASPPTEDKQPSVKPDLSQVSARKNLQETAFFFPQIINEAGGRVRLTFTLPEALTRWRFLGFAHDKQLRAGLLEATAVTAKDIMAQPNPPRFLREGDSLEFTVKVSNQSSEPRQGVVTLGFSNAATGEPVDSLLGLRGAGMVKAGVRTEPGTGTVELPFDIPAGESRSYGWRLTVPDGAPFLTYKAAAAAGALSDGEEGYLPVLPRRVLVTESMTLAIRGQPGGGETVKKFEWNKLLESGASSTLRHESLTAQMASQPAWYAVLALPYLMEFPHDCSEQVFNRLYANSLAHFIANGDPKIRRMFDLWRGTSALDSPLEKNQDLKAVLLEETPWLRQARNESQARRDAGILFDHNRLQYETLETSRKLGEMQLDDGRWPWFPGGPANDYITLYIVSGFGRLRQLGVSTDAQPALRALPALDDWMSRQHARIHKDPTNPREYIPSAMDALYLYARSFYLKDKPPTAEHRKALGFLLAQARRFWLETNNRQTQAHLALALKRFNAAHGIEDSTPSDIVRSLRERSVWNEEMGRFWRDAELAWWWHRAPIETQALMIEAFDEVAGDARTAEDCRVWLLKQKQTQNWKTTKATADAVYALLSGGKSPLASDRLVEMNLGGVWITPKGGGGASEPGTGFYERRISGADVKAEMGRITLRKADEGVSWGGVFWQYLEDAERVTPSEGTPLKLKKTLFTKFNTVQGPTLRPVKGALGVGDELVTRIELRVDRDMEFVHLKDQRGSGTEPVNARSQYRYQDGLAYYESTRDTATHFFIDYLPKGAYVFEYSSRIQQRGRYAAGFAQIECMYAPEFKSHSESLVLVVE